MKIDDSIQRVFLQFSFGSAKAVPRWAWLASQIKAQDAKKGANPSPPFIEPTENCSIRTAVHELENAGFKLSISTVLCQERLDRSKPLIKKYWVARYGFVRGEGKEITQEAKVLTKELLDICANAFWRVRAFKNPFYENGVIIPEQFALSINLEMRVPRFQGNGQPVLARRKNQNGKAYGDPVPLEPSFHLRMIEGEICLVPAEVVQREESFATATA